MGPPPSGEEKVVVLKCVGGEIGSAAALAPKLGPLGLVSAIPVCLLTGISRYSADIRCHNCVLVITYVAHVLYSPPRRLARIFRRPPWTGRVSRSLLS